MENINIYLIRAISFCLLLFTNIYEFRSLLSVWNWIESGCASSMWFRRKPSWFSMLNHVVYFHFPFCLFVSISGFRPNYDPTIDKLPIFISQDILIVRNGVELSRKNQFSNILSTFSHLIEQSLDLHCINVGTDFISFIFHVVDWLGVSDVLRSRYFSFQLWWIIENTQKVEISATRNCREIKWWILRTRENNRSKAVRRQQKWLKKIQRNAAKGKKHNEFPRTLHRDARRKKNKKNRKETNK